MYYYTMADERHAIKKIQYINKRLFEFYKKL